MRLENSFDRPLVPVLLDRSVAACSRVQKLRYTAVANITFVRRPHFTYNYSFTQFTLISVSTFFYNSNSHLMHG